MCVCVCVCVCVVLQLRKQVINRVTIQYSQNIVTFSLLSLNSSEVIKLIV